MDGYSDDDDFDFTAEVQASEERYDLAPGAEAALVFEHTDLAALEAPDLIDVVRGLGRLASWAQALQSRAIAVFAGKRPPAYIHDDGLLGHETVSRYVTDEVACALSLTNRGAGNRIDLALRLAEALPETQAAWQRGDLDWPRVALMADRTAVLPPDQAHAVETSVLPRVIGKTTGQTRRVVDRAVIEADPDAANKRHERARLDRDVRVRAADDGMATLTAMLCAEEAALAHASLTRLAENAPSDDPRTLGQRRADALMGLLGGESDGLSLSTSLSDLPASGKPLVQVVVAADTLTGADDRPADLVGFGPIPADVARRIAADASWQRILADPASGAVLDVGRTRYRPPAALVDHIRARDRMCTFPPCQQPAGRCQIDHAIPYDKGGETSADNLGLLCTRHHLLKTHAGWSIVRHQDGVVTWTSPTGHRYYNYPDNYRSYLRTPESPDPPPF
jgi:hypothetical protein